CFDHHHVASVAVKHLAELGHQSIGFVGASDGMANGKELWEGFAAACGAHDVAIQLKHVLRTPNWFLDAPGRQALAHMLEAPDRPMAIFAAGHRFALDVYRAAEASGKRIPQDVCLVGVDDSPSAPFMNPPLTAVAQPLMDLGKAAVHLLLDLIQD